MFILYCISIPEMLHMKMFIIDKLIIAFKAIRKSGDAHLLQAAVFVFKYKCV